MCTCVYLFKEMVSFNLASQRLDLDLDYLDFGLILSYIGLGLEKYLDYLNGLEWIL